VILLGHFNTATSLPRSAFSAIQPLGLAHDVFDPLAPDASCAKAVSEVLFQHHQLIGAAQITAKGSMQLHEIFEPAFLAQSDVLSNPFQIEKKKGGRLLPPGSQNIRVLQVIMIDSVAREVFGTIVPSESRNPSLLCTCGSGEERSSSRQ
jgi:hypothetical protein